MQCPSENEIILKIPGNTVDVVLYNNVQLLWVCLCMDVLLHKYMGVAR